METLRAAVVGGGSWGTAFANVLAANGHKVSLLFRDPVQAEYVNTARENPRYLPGARLDGMIYAGPLLLPDAIERADLVVLAIPSRAYIGTCATIAAALKDDAVILSLTKGLEPSSGRRLSEVAAATAQVGPDRVAVLSGPNHAEEIARGTPAATVIASASDELARRLQAVVARPTLRVYTNPDLVGVELAGAAKNVIAVAAGVSDGLGYGDNAKAALLTRGLAEMTRLGTAFGADPRTFAGLAGLGDLVATCCSQHSRNRRAGELLAQGVAPARLEQEIGMVAEGLTTAPTLRRIAAQHGLELPITERVCALLEGEAPDQAVAALMGRDPADELHGRAADDAPAVVD